MYRSRKPCQRGWSVSVTGVGTRPPALPVEAVRVPPVREVRFAHTTPCAQRPHTTERKSTMVHRFGRIVVPGAGLVLSLWLAPASAQACKCLPLSPLEAFAQATAVFEGRVLSVSEVIAEPAPHRDITLEAVRAWKGVEGERVTVRTPSDSAACGVELAVGASYFVYASPSDGTLSVSACGRTRPMAQADEDLQVHGMGQTPVDPKADPLPPTPRDEPPARGGCASCAVRAGDTHAPFAALLALAVPLLRSRRRR